MGDEVRVTVIGTGFDHRPGVAAARAAPRRRRRGRPRPRPPHQRPPALDARDLRRGHRRPAVPALSRVGSVLTDLRRRVLAGRPLRPRSQQARAAARPRDAEARRSPRRRGDAVASEAQRPLPRAGRRLRRVHRLRRTPCTSATSRWARLVDFAGWEMPVQYEGVRQEHVAVRSHCGIFDVSHMGEIETTRPPGARAAAAAALATTCRRSRSGAPSTACSAARTAACSTTSSPTAWSDDRYLTVTNAANHERDLAWFQRSRAGVRCAR